MTYFFLSRLCFFVKETDVCNFADDITSYKYGRDLYIDPQIWKWMPI